MTRVDAVLARYPATAALLLALIVLVDALLIGGRA